ncbi:hypothetical protein [Enterococcus italicus]|uniref:hypothetical protein n=1 Tax=Enterococcus italicus TaxID=246144 RepID=UPI003FA2D484
MHLLKKWAPFVSLAIISFFLVLPQILTKNSIIGADYIFHYNRFYDAAMQIKEGNFEYFLSFYGFQSSGRMVNALYGPLMAYLQGGLVLLAGTWFRYQVLSNFVMYLLSGSTFYYLLRRHGRCQGVSLVMGIVYMTSYCTLYWVFRQSFTSWGAALFPLTLLPLKDFIEKKEVHPVQLAVVLALMVQTHLFSSMLVIVIYFIAFCFVVTTGVTRTFFAQLTKAVGLFVLLTANIWGSFLSVYLGDTLQSPFINDQMAAYSIDQLGKNWVLYPRFLLVILFAYCLLYAVRLKHLSTYSHVIFWLSVFFGLLSTSLLPWNNWVLERVPFVTIIQFPFRFSVPFIVLGLYGFSGQIEQLQWSSKKWLLVAMPFCLFAFGQAIQETITKLAEWDHLSESKFVRKHTYLLTDNTSEVKESFHDRNLATLLTLVQKSTPDYLPTNKELTGNRYDIYAKEVLFSTTKFTKRVRSKGDMTVYWQAATTGPVTLPLIAYQQTELTLNGQAIKLNTTEQSAIGAITVTQQKGQNKLTIHYQESWAMRLSLWLTLVTWPAVLLLVVIHHLRPTKNSQVP